MSLYEAGNPPFSPPTLETTSSRTGSFSNETESENLKPRQHECSYDDTSETPSTTALLESMPLVIEMVTNVLRTAQNILADDVEEVDIQNDSVNLINDDNSTYKEIAAENVSSILKSLFIEI